MVVYAALVETGRMEERGFYDFNTDGGISEMIGAMHSPGMEVMTGSLGQGISQAAGIAMARKLRKEPGRVAVFMSDGEFQVGQTMEAIQAMCHHKLGNVVVFVDMNGQQCDGPTCKVCNIEPLDARLRSFGAEVIRIDGHDPAALLRCGDPAGRNSEGAPPLFVLCDTQPWHGMPFLKARAPKFHYVRFRSASERLEFAKLCDAELGTATASALSAPAPQAQPTAAAAAVEMVSRPYGRALIEWAKRHGEAVALSADLTSSVELDTFRDAFPNRFFSMGIAEQNMVSFAGGLAHEKFLPLVHTFAVFIYRRAFDQLAMSIAYPRAKVILCGFLPGILTPGGATHQAIEDVAVVRALPNMTILECGDATECESVLDVAASVDGPVYIRVLRGDVPRLFAEPMQLGHARLLATPPSGTPPDVLVLSSGVCTEEALKVFRTVERLQPAVHKRLSLLHISTLKPFDDPAVASAICSARTGIVTMENHTIIGGLGSAVAETMAERGVAGTKLVRLGLQDTFAHGASRTYLMHEYGIDAPALARALEALLDCRLGISDADFAACARVEPVHSLSKAEDL